MSKYRGRRFLAIDGEVIGGAYALLADSEGRSVERPSGLSTAECLEFLARKLPGNASWARVGFGLHLDVNHWVSDLPQADRMALFSGERVGYQSWRLEYVAHRIFRILDARNEPLATIYDAYSMFKASFLDVCRDWLGAAPQEIAEGKARRSEFTAADLEFVRSYNAAECRALEQIMTRVDAYLRATPTETRLRSYYGAGAIAANWLRFCGARSMMRDYSLPDREYSIGPEIIDAWERAYHGGRVEIAGVGTVGPIFRYDLNSAYAAAASHLGRVTYRWVALDKFVDDWSARMAVYLVRWQLPNGAELGPFPVRDERGAISYPLSGLGWYWYPEVKAARTSFGPRRIQVLAGWGCPDGSETAHLGETLLAQYRHRQATAAESPGGARLLKTALAAVWGKFAQRQSLDDSDRPGYWYCLPWAGWITSCVRAQLLAAVRGNEGAILAFSTDGITSVQPLDVPISDDLGGWRVERFDRGTFLLPGLFRLQAGDGRQLDERTRGFERASLNWDAILHDLLVRGRSTIRQRRFIGHVLADTWPEQWGHLRNKFAEVEIGINPAAIERKRVGGYNLHAGFDYAELFCRLGAHEGDPDYLGYGMAPPEDTPASEAEYWGDVAANIV